MERNRYMSELDSYMRTLLWQATGDEGNAIDMHYDVDQFDANAFSESDTDLRSFIELCEGEGIEVDSLPLGQVGHDFALTRNRHGTGFWDRGYGKMGDDLTKWAHTFGEVDVYVADDGSLTI